MGRFYAFLPVGYYARIVTLLIFICLLITHVYEGFHSPIGSDDTGP